MVYRNGFCRGAFRFATLVVLVAAIWIAARAGAGDAPPELGHAAGVNAGSHAGDARGPRAACLADGQRHGRR